MKLIEIEDTSQWNNFSEPWEALKNLCNPKHPFLDWMWIRAWLKRLPSDAISPILLIAEDGKSDIVAMIPLQLNESGFIRYVEGFAQEFSDYVDWLCIPGYEKEVGEQICAWIKRAKKKYDCVRIYNIFPEGFAHKTLVRLGEDNLKRHSVAPEIPIKRDFEYYLNSLDKKFVSDTRRRERKLAREVGELEYFEMDDVNELPKMLRYVATWLGYRRTEKEEESYLDRNGMQEYFLYLYKQIYLNGNLHLSGFKINGHPVAINIAFKHANRLFSYTPVSDSSYKKYSLIRLLKLRHIEECYKRGIEVYDFCLGGEQYKFNFKPEIKQLYSFTFYGSSLKGLMRKVYDVKLKQTFLGNLAKKALDHCD